MVERANEHEDKHEDYIIGVNFQKCCPGFIHFQLVPETIQIVALASPIWFVHH